MKKFKYISILVSLMFLISYSCQKEKIIDDEINYSKISDKEIKEHHSNFNKLFKTKKDYYHLKESIFEEGKDNFSSLSSIIETYKEMDSPDFSSVNLYLQMRNQQPINTTQYAKEGFNLFKKGTNFKEFTNYLLKYNIFSKEQIEIVKPFHNKVYNFTLKTEFNNELELFETKLYDSTLPIFERNSLLIYASLVQFYNPEWFVSNTNKTNTPCTNCINKNAWLIFGLSALWAIAASIACLLLFGWIGAIACLIGFFGASVFGTIWIKCRMCF